MGVIVGGDKTTRPDQYGREVTPYASLDGVTDFIMDEREVEIGDRISIRTGSGKWETRTVDSVTYDATDNSLVSGFVVSEPFDEAVDRKIQISSSVYTYSGTSPYFYSTRYYSDLNQLILGDNYNVYYYTNGVQNGRGRVSEAIFDQHIRPDDYIFYKCGTNNKGLIRVKRTYKSLRVIEFYSDMKPSSMTGGSCTLTVVYNAENKGQGTMEASECSGRGLCDTVTGVCSCFKGYMGHDCSKQNSLSF